jgi:hypothetical protein
MWRTCETISVGYSVQSVEAERLTSLQHSLELMQEQLEECGWNQPVQPVSLPLTLLTPFK